MPKIAIISDSHGSIENAYLFRKKTGQVDALYHLGDHADDALPLSQIFNCGFVSVRGNCDPFSDAPLTRTVDWEGHRILLLHGHTVSGRVNLFYFAEQNGADIVLFGHSHVPSVETTGGVTMINPGSLSRPRTLKGPSMAMLTLSRGAADVELLYL